MSDLISRTELKKYAIPCEIHNGALTDMCVPLYQIDNAPSVEILPENVIEAHTKIGYERGFNDGYAKCVEDNERPQGEWIAITSPVVDNKIHIICSNCKEEFVGENDIETWKNEYLFCHRCGADMRGGEEND